MGFIVVGIDGSATSREAFRQAIRQAEWRGVGVLVLHVVPNPVLTGYEFGNLLERALESGRAFMKQELSALEAQYESGFPVSVDLSVVMGHAGVEVLNAAKGTDQGGPAELVVLGSRGLGGFRGLLLGSVTTYAAHHLACPLLIVPPVAD